MKSACRRSSFDRLVRLGSYRLQGWYDLDIVVQQRGIATLHVVSDQIPLLRVLGTTRILSTTIARLLSIARFFVAVLFHPKFFEQRKSPTGPQCYQRISRVAALPLQRFKNSLLHDRNIRESHCSNIVVIVGLIRVLAKVVSVQPSPKAILLVAFEDLVIKIDFVMLIQVIKYHSCEQASNTGADDADLEGLGVVIFARQAIYYGGELVAALWRWLD